VSGIDTEFNHGALGENLTISGLLEAEVWVGDLLRFKHCTLRVSQPREPCFKFNAAMGFNTAVKEMALSGFCGFYLRVDEPGVLQAGESFELVPGPRNDTIAQRFQTKVFKHLR
jgi:MOSC domain-containing protein YiiM